MAYLNETGLARFWNHILSKLNEKATQSDIDTAVANLVNSAPETLDTLGELATALENNADVVETLNQAIINKVDKEEGKGLSTNDFTTAEKEKLAGLDNITIDSAMSDSSTNPVQNKVVTAAINELNTLVGDESVATQINNAVASKADAFHTHSADTVLGGYLNTHPENSGTIIPFMNNDLAFLLKKGGSAIVKFDDVVQTKDISNAFDGTPSYVYLGNLSNVNSTIIELTLHKTFTWSNTIYVDHGSAHWRAKSLKIEVMNTTYENDVWTVKKNDTNVSKGYSYVTFDHTPVGASNGGGGFNKIRLTFSDWTTLTGCRIAEIGVINYDSNGLQETFLSRNGGSVYGAITPFTNNTINLGSTTNKWANIYATTLTGNLSGTATKATQDANGNVITSTYATKSEVNNKVDKISGKGLSTNDFTTAEKEKLAGIDTGATKITVDSSLSSSSTNPVQNKIINSALNNKANSVHNQAASTITAGTFAGAVTAQTSSQTPATSLLRNSKLATTDTNPSYNGEICWTYG